MRRFVAGVLGGELAHDGELEDGLFELVDASFGGENGVEVAGDAHPGCAEFLLRLDAGERTKKGFDQGLVGCDAVGLLLLQLVAQG